MSNSSTASPYAIRPLHRHLKIIQDVLLVLAALWPAMWAATGGHPGYVLGPAALILTQRWPEWRSFGPPTRRSHWTMPYPQGQLGNPLYCLAMAYSVAWRFALCAATYAAGHLGATWWQSFT